MVIITLYAAIYAGRPFCLRVRVLIIRLALRQVVRVSAITQHRRGDVLRKTRDIGNSNMRSRSESGEQKKQIKTKQAHLRCKLVPGKPEQAAPTASQIPAPTRLKIVTSDEVAYTGLSRHQRPAVILSNS